MRLGHDEARAALALAYGATDMTKVTFTKFPDGLPCGSPRVADSFLGMQKAGCTGGGSVMWQDIVVAMAERKEWFDALDSLKSEDRNVLEATKTARAYRDVGMSVGMSGEYARRKGGKRALLAANDNLMKAITKLSA